MSRREELLACQTRLKRLSELSSMLRAALIESHAKTGRFNEPVASAMVAAIGAAIREVREDAHLGDVRERTRYERPAAATATGMYDDE